MERLHTKDAAEALLRELPSVLGAFVREDINGLPREIHILVSPGPNVKLLAQDIRDLLEEKLQIEIDHRVISIAQLAEDVVDFDEADLARITEPVAPERRLRFISALSETRDQRVRVRVKLETAETTHEAEALEVNVGNGRLRAAATATLRAAAEAAGNVRIELESVSLVRAFDREYVLVSVLAGAEVIGRRLLQLVGAQPVEQDAETATALATLKAINRILAKLLA